MEKFLPALLYGAAFSPTVNGLNELLKDPKEKSCVDCGKTHYHHNCFCSAECCKAYKK